GDRNPSATMNRPAPTLCVSVGALWLKKYAIINVAVNPDSMLEPQCIGTQNVFSRRSRKISVVQTQSAAYDNPTSAAKKAPGVVTNVVRPTRNPSITSVAPISDSTTNVSTSSGDATICSSTKYRNVASRSSDFARRLINCSLKKYAARYAATSIVAASVTV